MKNDSLEVVPKLTGECLNSPEYNKYIFAFYISNVFNVQTEETKYFMIAKVHYSLFSHQLRNHTTTLRIKDIYIFITRISFFFTLRQ